MSTMQGAETMGSTEQEKEENQGRQALISNDDCQITGTVHAFKFIICNMRRKSTPSN